MWWFIHVYAQRLCYELCLLCQTLLLFRDQKTLIRKYTLLLWFSNKSQLCCTLEVAALVWWKQYVCN